MERLDKRVLSLEGIQKKISPFIDINGLVRQGVLMEVGFTPTDLLHTTGQCSLWDRETAEAGLLFWAHLAGISPSELQERIKKEFDQTLALHMATKCLQEDTEISELWDEKSLLFMNQLLGRNDNGLISIDFLMKKPVVAVGAPVHATCQELQKNFKPGLSLPPMPRWPMPMAPSPERWWRPSRLLSDRPPLTGMSWWLPVCKKKS
jgi:N-methylhydantoinase A/oxoprolinase/acetone carboxylase beta subunit